MPVCYAIIALGSALALFVARRGRSLGLPWPGMVAASVLGAAFLPLAGIAEDAVVRVGQGMPTAVMIALAAGVVEEGMKALAAACSARVAGRFRGPAAAWLALGALAGVGMAIVEAASYHHRDFGEGWGFLPGQVPRLYTHMILGGLAGWAASTAVPPGVIPVLLRAGVLALAVCMHGLLDAIVLAPAVFAGIPGAPNSIQALVVVLTTLLFAVLLRGPCGTGSPRRRTA